MSTAKEKQPEGLALLRKAFDPAQIEKLPKPTRAQTDEVKKNFKAGMRCEVCGQWHHPKVVHLDYVGHAALTARLLDADPLWNWEPLAVDAMGLPQFDEKGGLWIKLTVCGHMRFGYGDAPNKSGGNAIKEAIGDALRNAAMRFGAALDLWAKFDLHADEHDDKPAPTKSPSDTLQRAAETTPGIDDQPWKGPLHRTALKDASMNVMREVGACGDMDQLDLYLASEECKRVIAQLAIDLHDWWYGDGKSNGLHKVIEDAKDRLRQAANEFPVDLPGGDEYPDMTGAG